MTLDPRQRLKIPEAARLYGVSYTLLDRAINAGELPTVPRTDAHRRVTVAAMDAWEKRRAEQRAS